MAQAEVKGDLVSIDREQTARGSPPGFRADASRRFAMFDRGEKGEDADKHHRQGRRRLAFDRDGPKWVIRLEGGAVWRQIDDTDLYQDPSCGLGGRRCKKGGHRQFLHEDRRRLGVSASIGTTDRAEL